MYTGLNILTASRQNWRSPFLRSSCRSQSRKNEISEISEISPGPAQKRCFWKRNVKFENFMHSKEREKTFFKGSVGDETRIQSFWNKRQKIDRVRMQLTRHKCTHAQGLKCKNSPTEILADKSLAHACSPAIEIEILLLARFYCSPAAWPKGLWGGYD